MRSWHHATFVYFLALVAPFFFIGCVPQPTPVNKDVVPVLGKPFAPGTQKQAETSETIYAPGDANYPEGYYLHTVSIPGENITIIAKWYTSAEKNWQVLVKCNPKIKPNRIFIGDKIKIPRSLLTKETALPPEFVQQSQAAPKRKTPKKFTPPKSSKASAKPATATPATPAVKEDPLLFGPKGY